MDFFAKVNMRFKKNILKPMVMGGKIRGGEGGNMVCFNVLKFISNLKYYYFLFFSAQLQCNVLFG